MLQIHYRTIKHIVETPDGQRPPFSFKAICRTTGRIIKGENCICTSSYHKGTLRIKYLDSGEFIQLHTLSIIEINGKEVVA